MVTVLAVCVAILFVMVLILIQNVREYGASVRELKGGEPVPATEPAASIPAADGIPPEVVAAISAAVFCMYPEARVTSLRRAPDRPSSAWRMAGLLENTHPF